MAFLLQYETPVLPPVEKAAPDKLKITTETSKYYFLSEEALSSLEITTRIHNDKARMNRELFFKKEFCLLKSILHRFRR